MLRDIDLLVVGDANPDVILQGDDLVPRFGQEEILAQSGTLVLGGSASIAAAGASALGLRTAIAACVGADAFGQFTLGELTAAQVDVSAVRVLSATATGMSVALARPDDRAVLTAPGALAQFEPDAVTDVLLGRARHVHIAGPFLQPKLRAGMAGLIGRAQAAGATVSLDPGWDPEDRWTSVAGVLRMVDVLLPNAQEAIRLAAAAGGQSPGRSPEAAAATLAAQCGLVVVKLGAQGALAFNDQSLVRVAAPQVKTVDATGAGDSFDAGFLCAWLGGAGLTDALALGCACGALSTREIGGTAGQPTRAEAEAWIGKGL